MMDNKTNINHLEKCLELPFLNIPIEYSGFMSSKLFQERLNSNSSLIIVDLEEAWIYLGLDLSIVMTEDIYLSIECATRDGILQNFRWIKAKEIQYFFNQKGVSNG